MPWITQDYRGSGQREQLSARSLKEDAEEPKGIARGGGSAADKAKKAAEAVNEPGAPGGKPAETSTQEHPRDVTGREPGEDKASTQLSAAVAFA